MNGMRRVIVYKSEMEKQQVPVEKGGGRIELEWKNKAVRIKMYEGWFEGWTIGHDDSFADTSSVHSAFAIVIKEDGNVNLVHPSLIQFIGHPGMAVAQD